ncbi:MAG TPA: hypothetical protein PKZ01_14325, partial [Candidatus Hydrogenedentes bacterium]|nr:hypothetical protein [Candidatus Hydrogenedentota bacterium]
MSLLKSGTPALVFGVSVERDEQGGYTHGCGRSAFGSWLKGELMHGDFSGKEEGGGDCIVDGRAFGR